MRKLLLVPVAVAAVLGTALPASAADTTVTFSVTAGLLSISNAPASAALSNTAATAGGSSVTGSLGSTTVTDERAALSGSWTVAVSSTDFTATGGLSIAKANGSIYSGAATATTGTVVFVPTTVASPVSLGAGGTLANATGVLGATSASYNPTLTVTVPTTTQAGDYTGTVTQTVS